MKRRCARVALVAALCTMRAICAGERLASSSQKEGSVCVACPDTSEKLPLMLGVALFVLAAAGMLAWLLYHPAAAGLQIGRAARIRMTWLLARLKALGVLSKTKV